MTYQDREGKEAYPYLTSWGATTRLVGALVMTHGDQKGLIIPPKIAPIQIVLVPIVKTGADNEAVLKAAHSIKDRLEKKFRIKIDTDETKSPGAKFYKWELRGVPLRIEIGPRDLQSRQAMVVDRLGLAKQAVAVDELEDYVAAQLDLIQKTLFERAQERMKQNWHQDEKLTGFGKKMSEEGGFFQVGWCKDAACEEKLKEYQGTIRCLIKDAKHETCFNCGKKSETDVLVAKAY